MPAFKKKPTNKKAVVVAVSGGFDPVHIGHVRYFEHAKKLGDKLVVILNNDHWLHTKKGVAFMPAKDRKELLESIRHVDEVIVTKHKRGSKDMSVCAELALIKPDIFANGGDRKADNIPEYQLCKAKGIKMMFNVGKGGKIRSSSWYLKDYMTKASKKKK